MTYGFEREWFVVNKETGIFEKVPVGLPRDECGYLLEARGESRDNPFEAAGNLLAKEAKLIVEVTDKYKTINIRLIDAVKLSHKFYRQMILEFGKNARNNRNGSMYGFDYPATDKFSRAGIHIHFGNEYKIRVDSKPCKECNAIHTEIREVVGIIDIPKYVSALDKAFKSEIKAAKRLLGLYELKNWGFEYRSLPASIDVWKVAEVVSKIV